jgi:hypothetical protein
MTIGLQGLPPSHQNQRTSARLRIAVNTSFFAESEVLLGLLPMRWTW